MPKTLKARRWYHCTQDDHGAVLVSDGRVPARGTKEPEVPRLCVAPSVAACFSARLFFTTRPVFVYRCQTPTVALMPHGVWDQKITQEGWLGAGVELGKAGVVPWEAVEEICWPVLAYHKLTKKEATAKLRIAAYALAHLKLPPEFVDPTEGWAETVMKRMFDTDLSPDEYILELTDAIVEERERGQADPEADDHPGDRADLVGSGVGRPE